MATTIITGQVKDPNASTGIANVQVTAVLRPRPAFETATGAELSSVVATTTDSNGQYQFTLTRTADIYPAESWYEITEQIPDRYGGPVKHRIQVGAFAATVYASIVSTPPPSTPAKVYLDQAAADARYVASPGSFSGTVVDSRPGDAGTSGVASSYSRGDHVHDRETQRGTAATISALSGTDLILGYPYVVTDAANITGAGIATPDTTSQPARKDGLWVKNNQRFQPGFWNQPWGVMGYAEVTANQGGITAAADLTGLTITFTAAANRRYKITAYVMFDTDTNGSGGVLYITDGTPTTLTSSVKLLANAAVGETVSAMTVETPAAGSITYKLRGEAAVSGTLVLQASSTRPAFILVEDIGPNGDPA